MSRITLTPVARPSIVLSPVSGGPKVNLAPAPKSLITLSAVGTQGPPGPAGGQALTQVAATPLSALRAVRSTGDGMVAYCDSDTPADATAFLGVTTTAGISVQVRVSGEVEGLSGLTPGAAIYVGAAGALVQFAPTSGFVLRIGFARTATKMFIEPGMPVYR